MIILRWFLQVQGMVFEYYFWFCESVSRDISLGILYGCKALLQIVALAFSLSIRKIKIKGLNDAISITVAVYVTSLVTAVIIVSFYTVYEYQDTYASLFCLGIFVGTTAILCLIFIPKVSPCEIIGWVHGDHTKYQSRNKKKGTTPKSISTRLYVPDHRSTD